MWSLGNEAGTGRNLAAMAHWIAPARPVPADPLRGRPELRGHRRLLADVRRPRRGRADRPARGSAAGRRRGWTRAGRRDAVRPVRVRARDGQRSRRPGRVPAAVRHVPALPGRLRLGVDRPRAAHAASAAGEFFGYGGDFGEELHDGNFVCDGLVFPDRTPSPGLVEIQEGHRAGAHDAGDAGADGHRRRTGTRSRPVAAASAGRSKWRARRSTGACSRCRRSRRAGVAPSQLPLLPRRTAAGEQWWTVTGGARRGDGVGARGSRGRRGASSRSGVRCRRGCPRAPEPGATERGRTCGSAPGTSDARRRALTRLGDDRRSTVRGWTCGVRRSTTTAHSPGTRWRSCGARDRAGPHAAPGRATSPWGTSSRIVVRAGRAGSDAAGLVRHLPLDGAGDGLRLAVDVRPEGDWPCPLPRLGLRMHASRRARTRRVVRAGTGRGLSGHGARGSRRAVPLSVDELQTPYVFPQENGHRAGVRWATITRAGGAGLRVEGEPALGSRYGGGRPRTWTSPGTPPSSPRAGTSGCPSMHARTGWGRRRADPACCRSTGSRPSRRPSPSCCGRCRAGQGSS